MNFYEIVVTPVKNGGVEISPDFQVGGRDSDLMVKGKAFSAIWDEEAGIWSTDEHDVQKVVDKALMAKKVELENSGVTGISVKTLRSYRTKKWDEYKSYVNKCPNQFHQLDDKLTFADTVVKRNDYCSKRLGYSVKEADHASYDEVMSTLYTEENRKKLEWAIGAILIGDSKVIQKFIVLNGKAGTGKGTFLKILKMLFDGYICDFSSKDLCNSNKDFRLEPFKDNPLVAVDEDGDLSRIEDATELNKIVSHERTQMNEKGKSHYPWTPHCMLFVASNEPVKIKNEESGLIRRLIDVYPTGKKISGKKYFVLMDRIGFELGGIAEHCLKVYKELGGKHAFDNYQPTLMIYRTNVFFNFIEDKYDEFALLDDGVSLKTAYGVMWRQYCEDAGIDPQSYQRQKFREELKNYFEEFYEVTRINGKQMRSWYKGFRLDCLERKGDIPEDLGEPESWMDLKEQKSVLDDILKDCKAQYEVDGKPGLPWSKVTTTLKDLDTRQTHYILPPEWLWMADFDLKNADGEKDAKLNLEAASKWPKTYAEFSKGGAGIHLYYRYSGDLDKLKSVYSKDIEVKTFHGKAAIRRRVSKCNSEGIATISSGLPEKEKKKEAKDMVDISVVEYERYLANCIRKAIRSARDPDYADAIESCRHTKPACDYIKYILDQAYESGKHYDVSNMRKTVYGFAVGSTNNKRYCTDLVRKMKWYSEDCAPQTEVNHDKVKAFYDIEVVPNVNMVNWKAAEDFKPSDFPSWKDFVEYYMAHHKPVVRMILPKPEDVEELLKYNLIGFNCRKYDNHILHALRLGYPPEKVYEQSMAIISGNPDGYFRDAWDYSYTDIYDFSSEKKSLKKFEIALGLHHQELGLPWDQPIPEERWEEVAEYCDNDVLATELLFLSKERQADWTARQILADIAGMNVNSTTNSLTTRIIFGNDRTPQSQFNYRFMGTVDGETKTYLIPPDDACGSKLDPEYTLFDAQYRPVFPGYKFEWVTADENGKKLEKGYWRSTYRGEEVGEGGYVYAETGVHSKVALLDVESMHPSSLEDEDLLGPYTKRFSDLKKARILIKHERYDEAKELFDGKLSKYLNDPEQATALSGALKIAINSVYGLTSAKFDNPFRDKRNKDNIVAKRGALFMINLKHEVQKRGYTVAHIKTDSIKIPNADNDIIQFVMDYGKLYGYNFEHEATYERMCLITKADYVAKYATEEEAMALYGYLPTKQKKNSGKWTETGDWFMDSYLFKTLFTHESIELEDMYEVNSVTSALYLDMNENLSEGEHNYIFVGKCGAFCPVKPGCGGGLLMRQNGEKFDSANGAKGYRWKEYEIVKKLGLEDQVDRSYYDKRTAAAKAEIEKFIPFDIFVSDEPLPPFDLVDREA